MNLIIIVFVNTILLSVSQCIAKTTFLKSAILNRTIKNNQLGRTISSCNRYLISVFLQTQLHYSYDKKTNNNI